jgi:hypothetical protein
MANKKKPTTGTVVIYTPYEDDAQLTGPSTGKIINVHEDDTVDIAFSDQTPSPGVLNDPTVVRQFVPHQSEDKTFNTWKKKPATRKKAEDGAEGSEAADQGDDTGAPEKAPEIA